MISIASDAAMYGLGTAFPISFNGLSDRGRTSDKYPNVPPTALLAEHWSLLYQRKTTIERGHTGNHSDQSNTNPTLPT
jgi:hypothetical protein